MKCKLCGSTDVSVLSNNGKIDIYCHHCHNKGFSGIELFVTRLKQTLDTEWTTNGYTTPLETLQLIDRVAEDFKEGAV